MYDDLPRADHSVHTSGTGIEKSAKKLELTSWMDSADSGPLAGVKTDEMSLNKSATYNLLAP